MKRPLGKSRDVHLGGLDLRDRAAVNAAIDNGRAAPAVNLAEVLRRMPNPGCGVVGADPGKYGGLVYLDGTGPVAMLPMPLREERIDTRAIRTFIEQTKPRRIYVELVHAHPTDGRSRAFSFGRNAGALESALAEYGAPLIKVDPQKWQNQMLIGLPRGAATKQSARRRCAELWPEASFVQPGCRVPHDGLCDAALLACYGLYFDVRVERIDIRVEEPRRLPAPPRALPKGAGDLL